MKCLSLWQPWASLVALELKRYETRSWRPPAGVAFRLAIHASKAAQPSCERDLWLLDRLKERGYEFEPRASSSLRLPRGELIAVATVSEVDHAHVVSNRLRDVGDLFELAAGDFSAGRFAWRLTNVQRFRIPIPYRGMQGLFEVPGALLEQHELEPAS